MLLVVTTGSPSIRTAGRDEIIMMRLRAIAQTMLTVLAGCAATAALFTGGMLLQNALGIRWGHWNYQASSLLVIFVAFVPLGFSMYLVTRRRSRTFFKTLALSAIPLFLIAVVLHNLIFGLTGVEEMMFFLLGVAVAPVMLWLGVIGLVAGPVTGWWRHLRGGHGRHGGGPAVQGVA